MARIKRMAWGTVAHWLESAATCAARFNDRMLKGFVIRELQADEIRTFVGAKKRVRWVLTTLEVWSRLWISFEIGRRNFLNIKRVLLDTLRRGRVEHRFLFTTDGFEMYEWAAKRAAQQFFCNFRVGCGTGSSSLGSRVQKAVAREPLAVNLSKATSRSIKMRGRSSLHYSQRAIQRPHLLLQEKRPCQKPSEPRSRAAPYREPSLI